MIVCDHNNHPQWEMVTWIVQNLVVRKGGETIIITVSVPLFHLQEIGF